MPFAQLFTVSALVAYNRQHRLYVEILRLCRPQPGVREWLDTLGRFNVPCALVSALDRQTVQVRKAAKLPAGLAGERCLPLRLQSCLCIAVTFLTFQCYLAVWLQHGQLPPTSDILWYVCDGWLYCRLRLLA
jgi:hypothetical protein